MSIFKICSQCNVRQSATEGQDVEIDTIAAHRDTQRQAIGEEENQGTASTKYINVARIVTIIIIYILSLSALAYGIFLCVECDQDVRGKGCAIGYNLNICSRSYEPAIALSIGIFLMFIFNFAGYMGFAVGLVMSLLMLWVFTIITWTGNNPDFLTRTSDDVIIKQLMY